MTDAATSGSSARSHYDVLGISPDSSQHSVHEAYRSVLAEFHANPTREMQERVKRARIAYRVVSDPASRSLYNRQLNLPQAPPRKWTKDYLEAEEEGLKFWTGFAQIAVAGLIGLFWQYLIVRGLLAIPRLLGRLATVLPTKKPPEEADQ